MPKEELIDKMEIEKLFSKPNYGYLQVQATFNEFQELGNFNIR